MIRPIIDTSLVLVLLVGCSREGADANVRGIESPPPATASTTNAPVKASIGQATMDPDGTIVLMLRAEGPNGAVGDGMIRYPKGHKDYDDVLKHLGGLKPGESKPVPPWPDTP